MFYSLLGRLVWMVGKLVMRRRLERARPPKPLLGVAAGLTVGIALAVLQRKR